MVRFDSGFSRRKIIGSAAAVAIAAAIPSVVSAQDGSPVASPATGEWTFTDDRGVTVTLPQRPTRVVADLSAATALWDFGIRPLAVSGWTVTSDASWGNVDRSVPVINASETLPEPDNEKLIELQPELFVSITWSPDDPTSLWSFSDPEALATAESIVPIVAISATGSAEVNTARFAELASLLGADLESPELVVAKDEYDASVTAFSELATEKADLSVLFGSAGTEAEWYAAYAPDWADLAWYQSLGLNIVEPNAAPGDYWETLSFEQALLYPSDIYFQSTRIGTLTAEELKAHTTFGLHPAVAAGQIGGWNQDFIMSYQGLKTALDTMIATISAAEKVT
jgi:iron complex transport system substrate-binding protein